MWKSVGNRPPLLPLNCLRSWCGGGSHSTLTRGCCGRNWGLGPARLWCDATFMLRPLMVQRWQVKGPQLLLAFIDLHMALDFVPHDALWQVLQVMALTPW